MNIFRAIKSFQMNRHLYFRTTPCYHGMILNVFLPVPLLNNAQNFNFFVPVQGWGISVANLSCQKKTANQARLIWSRYFITIQGSFSYFSVHEIQHMEELSNKVLNCIDKIEKIRTFGTIKSFNLNRTLSFRTVSRSYIM